MAGVIYTGPRMGFILRSLVAASNKDVPGGHQTSRDCMGFDPTKYSAMFIISTLKRTLQMAGGPHSSGGLAGGGGDQGLDR